MVNVETVEKPSGEGLRFFTHTENISRLAASDQVAIDGVDGLRSWLGMIASYDDAPAGRSPKETFQPALAV